MLVVVTVVSPFPAGLPVNYGLYRIPYTLTPGSGWLFFFTGNYHEFFFSVSIPWSIIVKILTTPFCSQEMPFCFLLCLLFVGWFVSYIQNYLERIFSAKLVLKYNFFFGKNILPSATFRIVLPHIVLMKNINLISFNTFDMISLKNLLDIFICKERKQDDLNLSKESSLLAAQCPLKLSLRENITISQNELYIS